MSKSPRKSQQEAAKLFEKVLAMDNSDATARGLLAFVYVNLRQHEKAIAQGERAVTLNPNAADPYNFLGLALSCAGRPEEAIPVFEKAIRLNPLGPPWYFYNLGNAYRMAGWYEESIAACKRALLREPKFLMAHTCLAATYAVSGRDEEARAEAAEILRRNPKYYLESVAKRSPYKNKADTERYIDALRKAGIPEKPPLPLPDKPSIAVLPFTNISGDPEQEYFSDGITEEIITALSKVPLIFVIARNSTFTYKGKPVKVEQVGRELGVQYVLEGSVRKAADKVRITAQLVDAPTGNHLWAERYDRDLKDIFALQDEITMKIIKSLQVKLTEGEQARIYAKGTENLDAYIKLLKGREHLYRFNKEGNVIARKIFEEAIALDPKYSMAYRFLAATHQMDVLLGLSESPRHSMARAIEAVQKAIALDDSNAGAHGLLSWLFTFKRRYDKAIAEAELAIAIDPNSADAHAFLGVTLHFVGRYEEAIALLNKAIRLNPTPPTWYFLILGNAYQVSGRFDESIEAYKEVLHRNPDHLLTHTRLAASYGLMGREEEALAEASEVRRIDPKFSAEHFAKKLPYKKQADVALIIDGLRKAGLK